MQAIRKKRKVYAVLFVLCALLIPYFVVEQMWETVFILSVAGATALILLIRQSRMVYYARLICSNSILTVPTAMLSYLEGAEEKIKDETIVSTFGALVVDRVYKWGCDGINGARLISIEIDKLWIALTFGSKVQTLKLELLHGLDNTEKVSQVKQKFLHETGIEATISGW